MKRLFLVLSVIIGAWMFSPTPEAQAWGWYRSYDGDSGCATVPELDPSAAGSAMLLLLGGVAVIASRRREGDLV